MKTNKIKNLFAVCLIAIFVTSLIPLAFADENTSVQTSVSVNSGNPRQDLAAARDAAKDEREKMKEERQAFRQERNETMQKFKDEREKLNQERKDFMEKMKENTQERVTLLKEAQEARKGKRENETIGKYRAFVSKTAGQWIDELNELKSKVQESTELTEQQKADITATIDVKITSITSLKAEVDASTTKEQLKDYTKQLRELRTESYKRLFNLRVLSARIQGHINKASQLQKRLDLISQRAKTKNVDISTEVSAFNAKIKDASDKNAQAQSDIAQVIALMKASGDNAQAKTLMDGTRDALKAATEALKQAQETLKSIVNKIKSAGKADVLAEASVSANATASS